MSYPIPTMLPKKLYAAIARLHREAVHDIRLLDGLIAHARFTEMRPRLRHLRHLAERRKALLENLLPKPPFLWRLPKFLWAFRWCTAEALEIWWKKRLHATQEQCNQLATQMRELPEGKSSATLLAKCVQDIVLTL